MARIPKTIARSHGVACQIASSRLTPNPGRIPNGYVQDGPIGGSGVCQAKFSERAPSEPRNTTSALSATAT